MQSSIECRRLLKMMSDEPINVRFAMAKCAAGLAIVVLLVVMAVSDERVIGGSVAQGTTPPRAAAAEVSAEAHRKQVFDERRQSFQGDAERRSVASEAVKPTNQLPVALR